jgi:hypothetical protein
MRNHKNISDLAGDTKDATQLYVKYKVDYYKLHVAEKLTTFATFAIGGVLLLAMLSLFLLFTSLAAAMYLGDAMGNNILGFLIVGLVYLGGIVVLLMLRGKMIQKPILKIIIRELFPEPKKRRV